MSSMTTGKTAQHYEGSLDRQGVADLAETTGSRGMHDPSTWGENEHGMAVGAIRGGHAVQAGIVLHHLWEVLTSAASGVQQARSTLAAATYSARDAISRASGAARRVNDLETEATDAGWDIPQTFGVRAHAATILWIALFAIGDLVFISSAMQILGLKDTPLVPGLPITELWVAASSSVAALLALAHFAGERLRHLTHAASHGEHESLRSFLRSELAQVVPFVLFVLAGAGVTLLGLAALRASYLEESDQPANELPFIAVNLGIFVAAMAVSWSHTHPFRRRAATLVPAMATSMEAAVSAMAQARSASYEAAVAVTQLETTVARAHAHVQVDRAAVDRNAQEYIIGVLAASTEPTAESLHLPAAIDAVDVTVVEKLLASYLDGSVTSQPLARLVVSDNHQDLELLEQAFESLLTLRHRIESGEPSPATFAEPAAITLAPEATA